MPKEITTPVGARTQRQAIEAPDARALQMKREMAGLPFDVQMQMLAPDARGEAVHEAAAHGTSGTPGKLPHHDAIQKAFGRHDVGHIGAHTDAAAAEGAGAMGAQAYASGDQVAFAGAPTLHTAAHEAAHVVQQRGGVSLKGGVGAEGDTHERHADAVADAVVQGKSAEGLLDSYGQGASTPGTQRVVQREKEKTGKAPLTKSEGKKDLKSDLGKDTNAKGKELGESKGAPEKEKPEPKGESKKLPLSFTHIKNLATSGHPVFGVTTNDGRELVLKYQSFATSLDEMMLGSVATTMGLKYPVDEIALHAEGSPEEQDYTRALVQKGGKASGSVMVMPKVTFLENQVMMSEAGFTNLGKAYALDIFMGGKDRFPWRQSENYKNLFMQESGDLLMLDTGSKLGPYVTKDKHKEEARDKLTRERRALVFDKAYDKALTSMDDQNLSAKVTRLDLKRAFHRGMSQGMKALFANKQEVLDKVGEFQKLDTDKQAPLLNYGIDEMFDIMGSLCRSKTSLYAGGRLYSLLV